MGSSWGDVLHNALKEAKGLPVGIVKGTAKLGEDAAVSGYNQFRHPLTVPGHGKSKSPITGDLAGMGQQYKAIGQHPIRQFQKAPIGTTLALLPAAGAAGKVLDVGAEAGAVRLLKPSDPGKALELPSDIRTSPRMVPGHRAVNAARIVGKDAKYRYQAYAPKYDDGGVLGNKPMFAGAAPGVKFDLSKLEQLHNEMGKPNVSHGGDLMPENSPNLRGEYIIPHQQAHTYLRPEHLNPLMTDDEAAADLTDTTLHEARHGWQAANWSRPRRLVDSYRPYETRKMEVDARKFAADNAEKYKGLTKRDLEHPDLAVQHAGLDPDLELENLVVGHQMGQGPTPADILDHAARMVKSGHMHPDDYQDLEDFYGPNPKDMQNWLSKSHASYKPLTDTRSMTLAEKVRAALPDNHPARVKMDQIGRGTYDAPKSKVDLLRRAQASRVKPGKVMQ